MKLLVLGLTGGDLAVFVGSGVKSGISSCYNTTLYRKPVVCLYVRDSIENLLPCVALFKGCYTNRLYCKRADGFITFCDDMLYSWAY